MIILLTGGNDFELTKKVAQLRASFDGEAERYDAADLTNEKLADIFAGQTLFALKRLIVIDTPSTNANLWQDLPAWADRLSEDTALVLVEPKPDKRTSTYKWLKKHADVQEFTTLDERDATGAARWVEAYAKGKATKLTAQQARRIAERAGSDQWVLAEAVDKLSLLDEVTDQWIDDIVEPHPNESVFALFETALNGDTARLHDMLTTLRLSEDPYRIFGLITSQGLQLAALVYGEGNIGKVASDIGAKSSYPLQKLAPYAGRMGRRQAGELIRSLAEADTRLKSSDADPWLVLESTLALAASR